MKFLNRERELDRLRAVVGSGEPGLVVVWGRRRVGKTRLLLEWCSETGGLYSVGDLSAPARMGGKSGAALATVELCGAPQIVTIRPSAYPPAEPASAATAEITPLSVCEAELGRPAEYLGLVSKASGRPDVSDARVIVSGGRAVQSCQDFERLVGGLADMLGGATGSTRALVDAGIAPNEFQVGQTGKIVAPDLYIALGLSGTVQHLAGMKGAKFVVAVNRDPQAPIFSAADYGLVADIYEAVPELIESLRTVRHGC